MDFSNRDEKWALLYLVDWQKGQDGDPMGPFPAIHGFYDTLEEAQRMWMAKTKPEKYYVRRCRNYTGIGF